MFKVLRSSAGAGKTHALVKQYLMLALATGDPAAYTRILALTFTNKAAAEMRERVLVYLQALASGEALEGAEADLQAALCDSTGVDQATLAQRARATHSHMLHHWGQVALSTIDAFTRRVVMPFARDLGLDDELDMAFDEEYYRHKAVDLLMEEAGSNPDLTRVLQATADQLLDEQSSWQPAKPLKKLAKQLTKEAAITQLARLEQTPTERFLQLQQELGRSTAAFRQRIRALGEKVMKAVADQGLSVSDFPYGKRGYLGYFIKMRNFDANYPDPSKRLEAAIAGNSWVAKNVQQQKASLIEGLAGLFREVRDQVEALRDTEMRSYFMERAILKDLMPTAALNDIKSGLDALKQEEAIHFFSDLTRKVMDVVQQEPVPFIYERLGERYKHILVDEFQDTSVMQWHALLPLVANALAQGGTVLLVGDAKQAIYRWRNGEARQFVELPDVFGKEGLPNAQEVEAALKEHFDQDVEPLRSNFRSGGHIIAFNNDLFYNGPGEGDRRVGLGAVLAAEHRAVYDRHEQELRQAGKGYVRVECYGKPQGDEGEEVSAWALMNDAVRECLEDGYAPGDIAVLVRSHNLGKRATRSLLELAGEMEEEHPGTGTWSVTSPQSLVLENSAAASGVVAVLAWLHRADDASAARAAQAIEVVEHGAEEVSVDAFTGMRPPAEVMKQWLEDHPGIHARLPLVALVTHVVRALGSNPAKDLFTMALLQETHAFANAQGDDLGGFLQEWERTIASRSAGGDPGRDSIQVMTVHRAKGLAFPVVIVPKAGEPVRGVPGELIWMKPDPPLEGLPAALVEKVKTLVDIGVDEMVEEERLALLDDLNVLYVAFTRARDRLYVSVPSSSGAPIPATLREHLQLALGEPRIIGVPTKAGTVEQQESKAMAFNLRDPGPLATREVQIRYSAPEGWEPASPDPWRSFGNAVHAVLERVVVPADLPAALKAEQGRWALTDQQMQQMGTLLGGLLGRPELEPFFSQGLQVINEATLIDAGGTMHRPDRVVRDRDMLRVLDFKTGEPRPRHQRQVKDYAQLLSEVEGSPVEAYLLYTQEARLEQVL